MKTGVDFVQKYSCGFHTMWFIPRKKIKGRSSKPPITGLETPTELTRHFRLLVVTWLFALLCFYYSSFHTNVFWNHCINLFVTSIFFLINQYNGGIFMEGTSCSKNSDFLPHQLGVTSISFWESWYPSTVEKEAEGSYAFCGENVQGIATLFVCYIISNSSDFSKSLLLFSWNVG